MIDLAPNVHIESADPLFLERLQAFLEKSLGEIQAFSERENMPFEEV
jgi:hypothetical protein